MWSHDPFAKLFVEDRRRSLIGWNYCECFTEKEDKKISTRRKENKLAMVVS